MKPVKNKLYFAFWYYFHVQLVSLIFITSYWLIVNNLYTVLVFVVLPFLPVSLLVVFLEVDR